jgi:hypothetical protein
METSTLLNEPVISSGAWTNFSQTYTAADFGLATPNPNGNGELGPGGPSPDFSATGAPLHFGFASYADAPPGQPGGPFSYTFGVDNYSLTLHTTPAVPEPATLYAGVGVVLFLVFFHIKRQRKITGIS